MPIFIPQVLEEVAEDKSYRWKLLPFPDKYNQIWAKQNN